ncbi:DUF2537 domain-containing protein [Gordonia sp. NPDC003376]
MTDTPPSPPPTTPGSVTSGWEIYVPQAERVVVGSTPLGDLERWRHAEPTPWSLGVLVTAVSVMFCALTLVGVYTLIGGIVRWAGLVSVLVVALAGSWTLWEFRFRPVWRWPVWGSLTGLLAGLGSAIALFALGQ